MREKIIALFRDSFIDDGRVFSMWLEGSDGLGCADEFSDIDDAFRGLCPSIPPGMHPRTPYYSRPKIDAFVQGKRL